MTDERDRGPRAGTATNETVNTHDTASAALEYARRGWQPIPVPRGSKAPRRPGWQTLRLSAQEIGVAFRDGQNVGVLNGEPSSWRVDVDCDWTEAAVLAPAFLPTTLSIFGRPGKPGSHYGYIAPGAVTLQLADPTPGVDPKAAMIVELRASGTQTLFPPSVHPNGERSAWDIDGAPAEANVPLLRSAVQRLAAASLITRYWREGIRHQVALSIAGALLRRMPLEDALKFVDAVARAAGDAEVHERLADVRNTATRLAAGERVTGIPTLAQIIPAAAADRFEQWMGAAVDTRASGDGEAGKNDPRPGHKQQHRSQATELVGLADGVELFHTPDLEPYATVPVGEHVETCPVRSRSLRRWLSHRYYRIHGKAPAQSAVQDALGVLEGRALYEGPELPVFVRVAEQDDAIYIDLADERWRCVEVTAKGWQILERSPVRFRRTRGMVALPDPVVGDIAELRGFLNVRGDHQFALLVAFLVAALRPRGPYPVLNLTAEQGSGKSTTQRVLRALTDPSTTPVRAEPRDVRDVMIAATNSWMVSFDNVSHLPPWLSDAICRLSTGGGFSTRELYSDADEVLFDAQRPVMMNGIEELAVRGDLLDRSIIANLPGIPEDRRRSERDFWDAFARARPRIFGGLLTAVATALANLPTTRLARLPRLADMALWIVAAEPALPWAPGTFIAAYTRNRAESNDLALEASPVVAPLLQVVPFTGTATELLALLSAKVSDEAKRQRAWPKNAVVLSNHLRRLAPNLRVAGVQVEFARDGRRRTVSVSADRDPGVDDNNNTSSSASQASRASGRWSGGPGGDDGPVNADDAGDDADPPDRPADASSDDVDDAPDDEIRDSSWLACRSCGGTDFWTRGDGGRVCSTCHPPASAGRSETTR